MHWFWFHVTANEFFETDRFFLSVSPSPPTLLKKLSIASWLHANQLKTSCESLLSRPKSSMHDEQAPAKRVPSHVAKLECLFTPMS